MYRKSPICQSAQVHPFWTTKRRDHKDHPILKCFRRKPLFFPLTPFLPNRAYPPDPPRSIKVVVSLLHYFFKCRRQSRLLFPLFIFFQMSEAITTVVFFDHSFSKERQIDWHYWWHNSKGNTQELKRKEILMYKVKENWLMWLMTHKKRKKQGKNHYVIRWTKERIIASFCQW
jgi:hypothetical protein